MQEKIKPMACQRQPLDTTSFATDPSAWFQDPAWLTINELMAENETVLPDEYFQFDDWFELHNAGSLPFDLSGMTVTDDLVDPAKHRFAAGLTVPAGGQLLFWADGEPAQGNNHCGFKLSATGEILALFESLGERDEADSDYAPHLFFLAHLLMKFKIFRWEPSVEDPETGRTMLRFTRVGTNEEVLIPNMEFPDTTITKIKEEIETYLEKSTGQAIRL